MRRGVLPKVSTVSGSDLSEIDALEALLAERWYDIDIPAARRILAAARELTDADLLRRPSIAVGAVIASDLIRHTEGSPGGDRAALLERFRVIVAEAISLDSRDDPRIPRDPRWVLAGMVAARWSGDFPTAEALSRRLSSTPGVAGMKAQLFDEAQHLDRPGQIALQRGLTELLVGRTGAAMELFAQAYRAGGDPPFRHFSGVNAAANAAMLAAIDGHDTVAQTWLERVGAPERIPAWCRDLIRLGATVASTVLATDVLDLTTAEEQAALLENAGSRFELWPFQLYALTQVDLAAGRPVSAYTRLKQAGFERNLTIATEPIADHVVFRAYLDTLVAGGEGGLVLRLAEQLGTPLRSLVPIAQTWLLTGDNLGAARVAARAMRRVHMPKRDLWEATVIHAIARMKLGDAEDARRSFGIVAADDPRSLPAILARQHARDVDDLYALVGAEPPSVPRYSTPVALDSSVTALTPRELGVLQHLVDGLSVAQIAAADVTSEHTVRTHVKRIYRKLGVSGRQEAIARANQEGIVRWEHQDGRAGISV